MKTILISGASGVLAQEYIRQTVQLYPDVQIIAISNSCEILRERYGKMSYFCCYSWKEVEQIPLERVSFVLHCAFSRTENGKELLRSLELTQTLLNKTGLFHIPFINISSRSVYGQNPNMPWMEESALSPSGMYALAKCTQELLVQQAAREYKFPYTNLRLAGLMGIGMDTRLISKLVRQALETKQLRIIGGKQQFALLDLRDAAAGILRFMQIPIERWETSYNLGSDVVYTLDKMAEVVKQTAWQKWNQRIDIIKQEKQVDLIDGMDCSRFYNVTGWKPQYHLSDTVNMLFQYYSEEGGC